MGVTRGTEFDGKKCWEFMYRFKFITYLSDLNLFTFFVYIAFVEFIILKFIK